METPILGLDYGGATARPFVTHHNEMDSAMYLRIAPELRLKQLVVAGFDRVFEIGRQFRNEGVDPTHNPEFTTCELYAAYTDYHDLMDMTEQLLRQIVTSVHGPEYVVECISKGTDGNKEDPTTLEFDKPFQRLDYFDAIASKVGGDLPGARAVHEDCKETRQILRGMLVIHFKLKMPNLVMANSTYLLAGSPEGRLFKLYLRKVAR